MVKSRKSGDQLIVYLSGEIDHCTAERLRGEIEALLGDARIRRLVLHFENVSFMDSSGVGMIIGRYKTMRERVTLILVKTANLYKTMRERGGTVAACGLKPPVEKLFRMAGLHRIIAQEEPGRQDEA